jgi:uric acid transporter
VFGSGITLGSLTAIGLNVLFHHARRREIEVTRGTVRLEEVNRMSREEFVAALGRLFQGGPDIVGRAYDRRPFADPTNLRAAFQEALFSAPPAEQRALMAAYPDLGADRVADGEEGEDSARDQASAGLTRLADDDRAEFATLAAAYRERFGFPLIVCVRDSGSRERVLAEGRQRLANSPAQEHAAALIEIAKVANHRFADLVAAAPAVAARTRVFGR